MTAGPIDPRDVRRGAKGAAAQDSEQDSDQQFVEDLAALLDKQEGEE